MTKETAGWVERLRNKWGLSSALQVFVILLVFACTGFTVMFAKGALFKWLGISGDQTTVASIIYYVCILPIYNLVLLAYGFLFGQFRFFWAFEVRFFNRLLSIFRKN